MKAILPLVLTALLAPAAWAQSAPPDVSLSGAAGWGGKVFGGEWVPVQVEVDNIGPDREILLELTWGYSGLQQSTNTPTPDSLAGRHGPMHLFALGIARNVRKQISTAIIAPDRGPLSVWAFALSRDGKKLLAQTEILAPMLESNKKLFAVVGKDRPPGLDRPDLDIVAVPPERLPEDRRAYQSLEALVWLDGMASDLRPAQIEGIARWVSCGGHLVLARSNSVGLSGTLLADLLPVKLGGGQEVENLDIGSVFPGSGAPLPGRALLLDSAVRRGIARLSSGSIPLVVESRQGSGRVTFVAFDPARSPFSEWPGSPGFWSWVLPLGPPRPETRQDISMRVPRHLGSVDLVQTTRRFPDVAPPAIGGLFALILAYLVVVGPMDYLVLRIFKRLELTWLTFPAYVIAFTVFVLIAGGAFVRTAAHQREIAVVDTFVGERLVRTRALGAVLAPAETTLGFDEAWPLSTNLLTRSLFTDATENLTDVRMIHGAKESARDFSLPRGATGLVMADRVTSEASRLSYALERRTGGELEVKIANETGLVFEDMTLVSSDGVYVLGQVGPGERSYPTRRTHRTLTQYREAEGPLPPGRPEVIVDDDEGGDSRPAGRATEKTLNLGARRLLIRLSFPDPKHDASPQPLTGLAKGLDASGYIQSGGTVLLGWVVAPECRIEFDPKPSRRTSVMLARFFRGPGP